MRDGQVFDVKECGVEDKATPTSACDAQPGSREPTEEAPVSDDTHTPDPDRKPVPRALRYQVLRRDGHTCRYCGAQAPDVPLTVDHVIPVALGGTNDPSNLVTACRDCNSGKAATPADAGLVADVDERQRAWRSAVQSALLEWLVEYDDEQRQLEAFKAAWDGWTYPDGTTVEMDTDWQTSYKNWLNAGLDHEVIVALIKPAMTRPGIKTTRWRYFCWTVWRSADEIRDRAVKYLDGGA